MTIGEQLKNRQPQIYNFLIDLFQLNIKKTDRVEPIEFDEGDYMFRHYKDMMEKPRGVKQ